MAPLISQLAAIWETAAVPSGKDAPLDTENAHVKALVAARTKTVADRRLIAEALKTDYRRGRSEETIEAIDRAIADEERMANPDAAHTPGIGFTGL